MTSSPATTAHRRALTHTTQDTGLFGVYAVGEATNLNDLMYYTLQNMVNLVHYTSEEDVERARTQLKSTLLMQLDGSSAVCDEIGRQVHYHYAAERGDTKHTCLPFYLSLTPLYCLPSVSHPLCPTQLLIYGRRLTPAELFARIDAVDAAAVKGAADIFINDKDVALAALGPIHELPDYNWLRRRTYFQRF